MEAEELSWKGYEVWTPQATWVCTKSRSQTVPCPSPTFVPDGIDYLLEFSAQSKQAPDIPDTRTLHLRTSEFLIDENLPLLELVIQAEMFETTPWDRFREIYKEDEP